MTRKLIDTRIFSTQSASGSNLLGKTFFQNGGELISKSINLAIKDSMEQLAERWINPDAPRNYAELNDQPKEHEKKEDKPKIISETVPKFIQDNKGTWIKNPVWSDN